MRNKFSELKKSIKLFFKNPGISKRYEFYGSIKSNTSDKYSDIDIEITPVNPEKFYLNFLEYLKNIDSYFVVFPVVIDKNPQVFTIVWKNHSLYKKLDIRINSKVSPALVRKSCDFDEKLRQFYDLFIGAIRFIKYRKRKQLAPSMKFYRSAYGFLKQVYSQPRFLCKYSMPKGETNIDFYFIEMLQKYLKISVSSNLIGKESTHREFAEKVIKFARNEFFGERD